MKNLHYTLTTAFALALTFGPASAQDQLPDKDSVHAKLSKTKFSPYAGRDFPTRVFWGDTHLHTKISVVAVTL